jgi:tetratricopeptide (TPR) repeat protein
MIHGTQRCWITMLFTLMMASFVPSVFAQNEKGCEGVRFAKHRPSQYSPANLQQRLQRNPNDVDALINLGLRLEEHGKVAQAFGLYEKAIQARPSCYLGYYFAGLAGERVSEQMISDAEGNIRKAITLNPELRTDPNVEPFMKRHSRSMGGYIPIKEETSETTQILATANRFYIGLAVGLLLATGVLYLARRKEMWRTK